MFERFTDRARRVVVLAEEQARQMDCAAIEPEHVLLALIAEGDGVAARALHGLGKQPSSKVAMVDAIELKALQNLRSARSVTVPRNHIPFTPSSKKILELSLREGLQLGHRYIGTEHILLAILRHDGSAAEVLKSEGVNLSDLRKEVLQLTMENMPKPEPPNPEVTTALAEAMEQIATANKNLMAAAHTISGLADKLR